MLVYYLGAVIDNLKQEQNLFSIMAKEIIGVIKLVITAAKANPSPPIGPALGQRGLNIMEFCKAFNAQTADFEPGTPVPVKITAYSDKTFTFVILTSPATHFIKKAIGVKSGSKEPGKAILPQQLKISDCIDIAKVKLPGMSANDVKGAVKSIMGSARSMGVSVVEDIKVEEIEG